MISNIDSLVNGSNKVVIYGLWFLFILFAILFIVSVGGMIIEHIEERKTNICTSGENSKKGVPKAIVFLIILYPLGLGILNLNQDKFVLSSDDSPIEFVQEINSNIKSISESDISHKKKIDNICMYLDTEKFKETINDYTREGNIFEVDVDGLSAFYNFVVTDYT